MNKIRAWARENVIIVLLLATAAVLVLCWISDQFIAFTTSPKFQVAERAFLGSSGWFGIHVMQWLGINPVQTGSLAEVLVQLTPALAAMAWGLYTMLEAKIIARAGQILADKQAGTVVIAPTAEPKLQAVADDPNAPGVNKETP